MSTKREVLSVPGVAPTKGPFSHVVRGGGLLFLTSQLSCDLATGEILPGDIRQQTRRALGNAERLLEGAGSGLDRVLRVRVYLRRLEDFAAMDEVYREVFVDGNEPARVTVQAPSPIAGVDIEIEVTALAC